MESLELLLAEAKRRGATEILLMAGDVPAVRGAGTWERLNQAKCTPGEMEMLVKGLLSAEEWETLGQRREMEVEKVVKADGVVHCDIHFQRGSLVMKLREQSERLSWG